MVKANKDIGENPIAAPKNRHGRRLVAKARCVFDNPLITAPEARRLLGDISEATEWRWRKRFDDFPNAAVISGRRYYRRAEIEAWIEARREAA